MYLCALVYVCALVIVCRSCLSLASDTRLLLQVSAFTTCSAPLETQRSEAGSLDVTSNLRVCEGSILDSLRDEHAKLFMHFATLLERPKNTQYPQPQDCALEHLVLQAWHALDIKPENLPWVEASGAVRRLGGLVIERASATEVGAENESELDSCGLWEAAMICFSRVTTAVAELSVVNVKDETLMSNAQAAIMRSTVAVACEMCDKIDSLPVGEARDVHQIYLVVWLHNILSRSQSARECAASKNALLQVLLSWALDAEAPQVQRVAMRVVVQVFSSAETVEAEPLKSWVSDALDFVAKALGVTPDSKQASPVKDAVESDTAGPSGYASGSRSASSSSASPEATMWKVVMLPLSDSHTLSSDQETVLEVIFSPSLIRS